MNAHVATKIGMTPAEAQRVLDGWTHHTEYGDVFAKLSVSDAVAKYIDRVSLDAIRAAADKAIYTALMNAAKWDPAKIEQKRIMTEELLSAFPDCWSNLAWEHITNEYCSDWCCWHRPWLHVHLPENRGTIKIGHRKWVISIDWSKTVIKASADELFPNEDVTKDGRLIHACSLGKTREYLTELYKVTGLTAYLYP